jgi:hypothetical protein
MNATIHHKFCLLFQRYYTYLGEPCSNCKQGDMVRSGIFDDADIDNLKKIYSGENIFAEN